MVGVAVLVLSDERPLPELGGRQLVLLADLAAEELGLVLGVALDHLEVGGRQCMFCSIIFFRLGLLTLVGLLFTVLHLGLELNHG